MVCQRTTNPVTYMFRPLGYNCTNYIDDFGGAETPDKSTTAFNALGDLFSSLGLESSPQQRLSSDHLYGLPWHPSRYPSHVHVHHTRTPSRAPPSLFLSSFFLLHLTPRLTVTTWCDILRYGLRPPCSCFQVNPSQHPLHSPRLSQLLFI